MKKTGVVYGFLDENGVPFYLGISVSFDSRKRNHRLETKKGNPLPKYNKMRKIVDGNWEKVYDHIVVLEEGVLIENLHQREIDLIKEYRDKGINLYNLTDGGEGCLNPSPELLEKLRQSRIGSKRTEQARKKMSEARKGIVFTEEHKKNLSKARKKRKTTQETRDKTSKTSKGKINIKVYELIDPEGEKHLTHEGLTLFCEQHGLNRSMLYSVIRGERQNYKGWKINQEKESI